MKSVSFLRESDLIVCLVVMFVFVYRVFIIMWYGKKCMISLISVCCEIYILRS